jgi:hypothetical protein
MSRHACLASLLLYLSEYDVIDAVCGAFWLVYCHIESRETPFSFELLVEYVLGFHHLVIIVRMYAICAYSAWNGLGTWELVSKSEFCQNFATSGIPPFQVQLLTSCTSVQLE